MYEIYSCYSCGAAILGGEGICEEHLILLLVGNYWLNYIFGIISDIECNHRITRVMFEMNTMEIHPNFCAYTTGW